MLDKLFKLKENGTNVRTEIVAGITTFLTLSYIIFVQPAVLSATGMNPGSVMLATCISSAIACVLMALLANYPIALAPAMGHNFFFAFTVCLTMGFTWQQALAANCLSGTAFVLLSLFAIRTKIMSIIPEPIRLAIAVGIGLLICLVGLEYAGIVVEAPGTYVKLGNLKDPYTGLALFGLLITMILMARGVKGAVLGGMIVATTVGLLTGLLKKPALTYEGLSLSPTFFKLDFHGLLARPNALLSIFFVFLFLDLFDTVGTLAGVCSGAGLFDKDGNLPNARQAFLSDAAGTVIGTIFGTSTITSYVESAAGVQAGGRTGLTSMVTAVLLLAGIVAYPFLGVVAAGIQITDPKNAAVVLRTVYPVIAPALIIIGAMMMMNVSRIRWNDPTEYLPAYLTIVVMPLAVNITEGIAFGFISMSILKTATGRSKDVHWSFHLISILFILRYIFLSA
ncbi:MAG TPA: NCS2 family permease [Candidatus Brocadiia bacterium]|nr:NCS2 family permease [Candidatus Brocadiia bacterium]